MNQQQNPMPDRGYRYDPQTGIPIYTQKPPAEKENFSVPEVLFAWLSLLAGYAFCRVFPVTAHPFGGMLFIFAIFITTAIVLKCKGASFGAMPVAVGLTALLLTPALFISANAMIHFLVYVYALVVWCYFVYAVTGNQLEHGYSDLLIADFFKAVFVMPFASFEKLYRAVFSGKGKGSNKSFLKILLGVAIAIIPTAVVVALLSYDRAFVELFQKLIRFSWAEFFSHVFSAILGIPVGMYFYGLFYSSHKQKCGDTVTAEKCRAAAVRVKIVPAITAVAATLPVLAVYVIFFISQWQYYVSAFSGLLPNTTSFADYARSGFFQLCAVSVINLVFIILLQLFVRRKQTSPTAVTRVLSIIFSFFTMVLIATAIAKLALYVNRYGLTPKRVYAGWFMLMLAVIFVLILLKQVIHRIKLVPTTGLVCVVLFGVLALSGSDTLIAEYNVNRYLNGTLQTVDVDAMEDLGDAAVPAMVRLVKQLDQQNGTDIRTFDYDSADEFYEEVGTYLYNAAAQGEYDLYSFTLPRAKAVKALRTAGIKAKEFVVPEDPEEPDAGFEEIYEDFDF